jgi:hypothetical protein
VGGAKPNVLPMSIGMGWQNLLTIFLFSMDFVIASQFKFFCAVGKKLKHETVGCCVGKSLPVGRYLVQYF